MAPSPLFIFQFFIFWALSVAVSIATEVALNWSRMVILSQLPLSPSLKGRCYQKYFSDAEQIAAFSQSLCRSWLLISISQQYCIYIILLFTSLRWREPLYSLGLCPPLVVDPKIFIFPRVYKHMVIYLLNLENSNLIDSCGDILTLGS